MCFYREQHSYYCGVDLHARTMYLCILDARGTILLHRRIPSRPEPFLELLAPYEDDLVVCAECIFCSYWLADLCLKREIAFVLAHALYLKAIHGGKAKNDRIDSEKLATLLRGGSIPMALRLPTGHALDPRSPAASALLQAQAGRAPEPYPEHLPSVQPLPAPRRTGSVPPTNVEIWPGPSMTPPFA